MKDLKCKRLLAIFLGLTLTTVTACSSSKDEVNENSSDNADASNSKVTVYYEDKALSPYFEYINQKSGSAVYDYIQADSDDFIADIAYNSTISDNPCDVFVLNCADMEKAYYAAILEEVGTTIVNTDNYAKSAIQSVTYKNKIYGYPLIFSTSVMVYNKAYTTLEPQYFTQIEDFANNYEVTENNAQVQSILSWDTDDAFINYAFVAGSINPFGVNGDSENVSINNEEVKEALAYYQSLNSLFYMELDDDTYDRCLEQFRNGALCYTILRTQDLKAVEDSGIDYGIVPVPDISDTIQTKSLSNNYCVVINPYSKNKTAAKAAAEHIAYYYADKLYEVTGDYSCVKKYSSEYEQVYRAYEKSVPVAKIMNIGDYYTDWHIALYNIWSGGNIEENLTMIEDDMKAQFEKK